MENCKIACDRQQKHVELYSAIEGLNEIGVRLSNLRDKIKGPVPPGPHGEKSAEPRPSLFELLNCGATRVREMKDKIIEQINELDDLLF